MTEFQSPEQSVVDMEEVTLKDLSVQLSSNQRNMDSALHQYSEPEYGRS